MLHVCCHHISAIKEKKYKIQEQIHYVFIISLQSQNELTLERDPLSILCLIAVMEVP